MPLTVVREHCQSGTINIRKKLGWGCQIILYKYLGPLLVPCEHCFGVAFKMLKYNKNNTSVKCL